MKKLVLILIALFAINCENPSMERGLEGLQAALAELEASFLAIDVEQMSADVDREMKTRKDELLDKELEIFMQNAMSVNKFTEVEPRWFSI